MELSIRRILCPTDFSEASNMALKYAVALGALSGAEIHVLHIIDVETVARASRNTSGARGDLPTEFEKSERELSEAIAKVGVDYPDLITTTVVGHPVVEIKKYSEAHEIDFIVIGTHGLTGVPHMLIGSVAEKLIRVSKCPVLTVHDRGHQFVPRHRVKNAY